VAQTEYSDTYAGPCLRASIRGVTSGDLASRLLPVMALLATRAVLVAVFAACLRLGLVLVLTVLATFMRTDEGVAALLLAHAFDAPLVALQRALVALGALRARRGERFGARMVLLHLLGLRLALRAARLFAVTAFVVLFSGTLVMAAAFGRRGDRARVVHLATTLSLMLRGAAHSHTDTKADCD